MKILQCCFVFSLLIGTLNGCEPIKVELPPIDRPYFPAAIAQRDQNLFIVSYNKDLRYGAGSILTLDLKKIDEALAQSQDPFQAIIASKDIVLSSIFIPSFSRTPVFTEEGELLLISRQQNQLLSLNFKSGTFSCGENCLEQSIVSQLAYDNPYYLSLYSEDASTVKGIVGYLNELFFERFDSVESLKAFEESKPQIFNNHVAKIQTFTWDKDRKEAVLKNTYRLQDILPTAIDPKKSSDVLVESHLSGVKVLDNWLFLAESAAFYQKTKNARLLWLDVNRLEQKDKEAKQFDLTSILQGVTIAGFEVVKEKEGKYHAYIAMKQPTMLVKVDLLKDDVTELTAQYQSMASLCDEPIDIVVAPDQKTILVACGSNEEIAVYDADSLALVSRAVYNGVPFGRGPVHIWFDQRSDKANRAYVSYWEDGSIGIFEVGSSLKERLRPLGRIFEQAAFNHPGGK